MASDTDNSPGPLWLPEDEAHRLLARAVELDERHAADISLEQLRAIATEAGIGSRAFELAVHELRAGRSRNAGERSAPVSRLIAVGWNRIVRAMVRPIHVTSAGLANHRRHAFVAFLATAMIVTPGDLVVFDATLCLPPYVLYEISILVMRWQERRKGRSTPTPLTVTDATRGNTSPTSTSTDRLPRSLLLRTA